MRRGAALPVLVLALGVAADAHPTRLTACTLSFHTPDEVRVFQSNLSAEDLPTPVRRAKLHRGAQEPPATRRIRLDLETAVGADGTAGTSACVGDRGKKKPDPDRAITPTRG